MQSTSDWVTRFLDLPTDLNDAVCGGQQLREETSGVCGLLSFRGVIFVPRWFAVVVPVHSLLCCYFVGYVLAERNSYDLAIILDSLWRRHHVWPDGRSVFAELHISLYDPCRWECR